MMKRNVKFYFKVGEIKDVIFFLFNGFFELYLWIFILRIFGLGFKR